MAKITLSSLAVGAKIKLEENGVAKPYVIGGHGHHASGRSTLFRQKLVCLLPQNTYFLYSSTAGYSNCYLGCIHDAYLNGFMDVFPASIQALLAPVPIPMIIGYNSSEQITLYRRIFTLSATEAGLTATPPEGATLAYFTTYPATENKIGYDESDSAQITALRTPVLGGATQGKFYSITTVGAIAETNTRDIIGVRPALTLPSTMELDSVPDADGCYLPLLASGENGVYVKTNGVWAKM